jgi:hypothetical protein
VLFRISSHVVWKSISNVTVAVDAVKGTVGVFWGYGYKIARSSRRKKQDYEMKYWCFQMSQLYQVQEELNEQ